MISSEQVLNLIYKKFDGKKPLEFHPVMKASETYWKQLVVIPIDPQSALDDVKELKLANINAKKAVNYAVSHAMWKYSEKMFNDGLLTPDEIFYGDKPTENKRKIQTIWKQRERVDESKGSEEETQEETEEESEEEIEEPSRKRPRIVEELDDYNRAAPNTMTYAPITQVTIPPLTSTITTRSSVHSIPIVNYLESPTPQASPFQVGGEIYIVDDDALNETLQSDNQKLGDYKYPPTEVAQHLKKYAQDINFSVPQGGKCELFGCHDEGQYHVIGYQKFTPEKCCGKILCGYHLGGHIGSQVKSGLRPLCPFCKAEGDCVRDIKNNEVYTLEEFMQHIELLESMILSSTRIIALP